MFAPKFLAPFVDPPNSFRPWPFLVLNDEYEPGAGETRLTELLENLARVGYGGVFLHPRPGLITEYLSPRWFEIIRHCLAECRRLSLVCGLYDENSYPSGFAGGHVPALAPQTTVRYLTPKFGALPDLPPADALTVYRTENGVPVEIVDPLALAEGASWCAFVIERMHPMAWHGEFPYVSLLDPQTTTTFLETTYQRYQTELGEQDWKSCAAFFTDEPHLPSDSHGPWGQGQHFSRLVQSEFHQRRGYGIETVVADLYYDSPTSAATRFDFYETIHAMWMENFALPLETWCRENGIPLTGHYLEHDWPCPYATPGHIHLLAHMDWPGTDLLECFLLEGHDYGDPQNLGPAAAGTEPHALYFLKQVQSVANQLGKERVMNESWGAGGHDSTPQDWLRIGRFLAVHGVNLFVPHFSPTTIRGARKKDHPQFFGEQSPWFENLGPLNAELGRLSWMVGQGRTEQRILLIDPLTTGYCLAAKSDCVSTASVHDTVTNPLAVLADTQKSLQPLRQTVAAFAQSMADAQMDFDVGDEYVLAEFGKVEKAGLRIQEQCYQLIVLPPGLQNLRSETLQALRAFASGGGKIAGIRPSLALLDGRVSQWPSELPVQWCASEQELLAFVEHTVPPRLSFSVNPPAGIAHLRRRCEEGTFYLIVNSSPADWATSLTLPEPGPISLLDPQTGEARAFDSRLSLSANSAVVLFIDAHPTPWQAPAIPSPVATTGESKTAEFLGAERLHPNIHVIDFCALDVGHDFSPPQLVYETNRIYWEKHGMETNGWANLIQYRDHVLSANRRMPSHSGGAAQYAVHISPEVDLEKIDLCFECPDQWTVMVNGHPVEAGRSPAWLDWRIARLPIGHLLHPGENSIHLVAKPFDVRQEIDQIYLLGDFRLRPAAQGFHLVPRSEPLHLGSWKSQGLPFYDRKVAYRFRRSPGTARLTVSPGSWYGSVLEFTCGARAFQTYGPGLDLAFTLEDPEEFSLVVTGLPLNLLGPWHKPGLLSKHGWASFWHGGDIPYSPQPGAAYHHLDLGLFQAPEITNLFHQSI